MAQEEEKEGVPETPEQIIAEFNGKNVNEQRGSIVEYLNKFRHLTEELPLIDQIKHKVNFLQSIKHQVLTRHSGMLDLYYNASTMFLNFIVTMKRNNFNKIFEKLTDDEKLEISIKLDDLLQRFIKNLDLQKSKVGKMEEHAKDLESFIEVARDAVISAVGIIQRREKEKEKTIANDLGKQAESFRRKGFEYRFISMFFLVLAVSIVSLIFYSPVAYDLFPQHMGGTDTYYDPTKDYLYFYIALKIIFSKSTLFAIAIITALFSCIRFYAANNHNAIICDQRANTLNSYKALRDSAKTEEEGRLILQKVLDSATDHQVTGFSKLESNDSDNVISKIISDLVKIVKR